MPLTVIINGQNRTFASLESPVPLAAMIESMELKADRIAVEHNGEIAPRSDWSTVRISSGDRLEIVHFVGGGCGEAGSEGGLIASRGSGDLMD
jgi:sulfur carrier protein